MRRIIALIVMIVGVHAAKASICDTVKVYFNTADHLLSQAEKQKLDELVSRDILKKGERISITGYADKAGNEKDNINLSQKRADEVAKYFVSKGWKKRDIELVMGKGEEQDTIVTNMEDNPKSRRVDVIQYGRYDVRRLPEHIFFIPGTDTVRNDNLKKLDTLLAIMKTNPCIKIYIEGNNCCSEHNMQKQLKTGDNSSYVSSSISRDLVIGEFLIKNGIPAENGSFSKRFIYNSHGIAKPLFPHPASNEEHAMNCRVDIFLVDSSALRPIDLGTKVGRY